MGLLVPTGEAADPVLDPHLRAVAQVALGAAQIRGRDRHVARLVGPPLDAQLAPQGLGDELQQAVESHPRATTDVERGARRGARVRHPVQRRDRARHRIRNIGVVALARSVPVHRDRVPRAMPAVKRWIARSGRWRGPYTVKYRRQAIRIPYKCANACATSSAARLLAAYGEIGAVAGASSAKGADVVSPYTDEDDARMTVVTPARRDA